MLVKLLGTSKYISLWVCLASGDIDREVPHDCRVKELQPSNWDV